MTEVFSAGLATSEEPTVKLSGIGHVILQVYSRQTPCFFSERQLDNLHDDNKQWFNSERQR
jgi:hypothetical protein